VPAEERPRIPIARFFVARKVLILFRILRIAVRCSFLVFEWIPLHLDKPVQDVPHIFEELLVRELSVGTDVSERALQYRTLRIARAINH
jgi:hypothetical protein